MEKNWNDKMRKRMENYEEPAPDGLWENIERATNIHNGPVSLRPTKRHIWQRIAAVAATLAIAIVCTLSLLIVDNHTPLTSDSTTKVLAPYQQSEEPVHFHTEGSSLAHSNPQHITSHPTVEANIPSVSSTNTTPSLIPQYDTQKPLLTDTGDTTNHTPKALPRHILTQDNDDLIATQHITMANRPSKSFTQWSASVFLSNTTSGSHTSQGYAQLSASNNTAQASMQYANENNMLPLMSIIHSNARKACQSKTKHSQPLRTGITVRYNIDHRWSIESGITYTMLHSQLQSGSESYYYLSKQTLHYIGVPVKIGFNIWENRWFLFYVLGGMTIEKCVDGNITTDYVMEERSTTNTTPISTKPLQWSINAAAGAQFNILPQLGLYIEPGGSFYFDDGTAIENIYKERPLNFSIELGLRVSIK